MFTVGLNNCIFDKKKCSDSEMYLWLSVMRNYDPGSFSQAKIGVFVEVHVKKVRLIRNVAHHSSFVTINKILTSLYLYIC